MIISGPLPHETPYREAPQPGAPPAGRAAEPGRADGHRARRTSTVLRAMLRESEPELDDHHVMVGDLAAAVAVRLGLSGTELEDVVLGAELHDIGKIAIPPAVLHKPGPLTDDEWHVMRTHTTLGELFLATIPGLATVAPLVRSSHERWDGAGYPDGLAGAEIPLGSRIIFACDAYDAMTADRVYRKGMPTEAAVAELRRHAGTQFDPAVVDALCAELAHSPRPRRATPA